MDLEHICPDPKIPHLTNLFYRVLEIEGAQDSLYGSLTLRGEEELVGIQAIHHSHCAHLRHLQPVLCEPLSRFYFYLKTAPKI